MPSKIVLLKTEQAIGTNILAAGEVVEVPQGKLLNRLLATGLAVEVTSDVEGIIAGSPPADTPHPSPEGSESEPAPGEPGASPASIIAAARGRRRPTP